MVLAVPSCTRSCGNKSARVVLPCASRQGSSLAQQPPDHLKSTFDADQSRKSSSKMVDAGPGKCHAPQGTKLQGEAHTGQFMVHPRNYSTSTRNHYLQTHVPNSSHSPTDSST
ncbi:hypothetical protein E2C01_035341 [Portunus trituberculatus]|uniref:Uncharacterized protein n=1 Tax=Portunus trituberculatus TaxID=210409 RepID=A0A5B7F9H9_PORTR|nr:hypothetical protein [Portunus trituberculatus]